MATVRILAVVMVSGMAQAQVPAVDARRGEAIYMRVGCYTCHGTAGQGGDRGAGPRIAPGPVPWESFAQMTRRPRASMPRYPAEHLGDAQLADIHAYLASVKRGPGAKDIPLLAER